MQHAVLLLVSAILCHSCITATSAAVAYLAQPQQANSTTFVQALTDSSVSQIVLLTNNSVFLNNGSTELDGFKDRPLRSGAIMQQHELQLEQYFTAAYQLQHISSKRSYESSRRDQQQIVGIDSHAWHQERRICVCASHAAADVCSVYCYHSIVASDL
jgi:hypothetical protein